ncbi:MAG: VCBS repeat-containing protein [Chitinophagales bacterium]
MNTLKAITAYRLQHLHFSVLTIVVLLFISSCYHKQSQFEILYPSNTGLTFNPLSKRINSNDNGIKESGNGVAIGDFNKDGMPDILLSGIYANPEVYLNEGEFHFRNITESSGIQPARGYNSYGASIVDINGDGWDDIYLCQNGSEDQNNDSAFHNLLYVNNRNNTFSEESAEYGLNLSGHYYMPYFFDYDRDNDVDIFILGWPNFNSNPLDISFMGKALKDSSGPYSLLMENNNGHYINVTREKGIKTLPATNNSCVIADINRDSWPDIFVANDFIFPDQLYINHKGYFKDEMATYFSKTALFSMGVECEDFNNDLYPDLLELDMLSEGHYRRKLNTLSLSTGFYEELFKKSFPQYQRNFLHLSNKGKSFSDVSYLAGIESTEWSWTPLGVDFDNDGWKDIFITAGSRKELTNLDQMSNYQDEAGNYDVIKQWQLDWRNIPSHSYHNYIFRNRNGLHFINKTIEWGLSHTTNSEGAAYADFDNDGDLDLILCNTNVSPYILCNHNEIINPQNKWLTIKAQKGNGGSNIIGLKAIIYFSNKSQYAEITGAKGFLSTSEPIIHFGTDTFHKVDSLRIIWPDGRSHLFINIETGVTLNVREDSIDLEYDFLPSNSPPQSMNISAEIFCHREDNFDDFRRDKIIPHRISRMGPSIASGDVDNDGDEDFYIGGAAGQSGILYIQQSGGNFLPVTNGILSIPETQDVNVVAWCDINRDSRVDLIMGKGSNAENIDDSIQHLSILINFGNGSFKNTDMDLPRIPNPISTISINDFDGDSLPDIFIGCRIVAGKFGNLPNSYILKNQKGKIIDITQKVAPELYGLGMVTTSSAADIDNDQINELIVSGEFMQIQIFKKHKGIWSIATNNGLKNTNGLWGHIQFVDIDNDGDLDLFAGNWGLNSIWRASISEPLSLWVNDFDGNGITEAVLFHYLQNVSAPFINRDLFCKQMPKFFNQFNNYESYASATEKSIFNDKTSNKSQKLEVFTLNTSLFLNNGYGRFILKQLPLEFQKAPVQSFVFWDFNEDGKKDVIVLGNSNSNFYDQGDIDALRGTIFLGDGKGNFLNSGKDILDKPYVINNSITIKDKANGKSLLLLGVNNDSLKIFTISDLYP